MVTFDSMWWRRVGALMVAGWWLVTVTVTTVTAYTDSRNDDSRYKIPPSPGALSSYDGGPAGEQSPPVYRPPSQSLVVKQLMELPRTMVREWEREQEVAPENKNCLLCETQDSGSCRNMPSCVHCERTATALCERNAPCMRCTVIKNPFFKCIPGEKYMDECNSCRCMDGHSGWCSNQFCDFSALYLYAIKISDGEFY